MNAPKARLPLVDVSAPRVAPALTAPSERAAARPLLCVLGDSGAAQSFARAFAEQARSAGVPLVALIAQAHSTAIPALRERGVDPIELAEAVAASEDALAAWLEALPARARVLAVGDLLPSLVRPTYTVALGRSVLGSRIHADLWLPRAVPAVAAALADIWAATRAA